MIWDNWRFWMQRRSWVGFTLANVCTLIVLLTGWLGWVAPASALNDIHFSITTMSKSLLSFSGKRPTNLGVQTGKLAPCPQSPNCVSSQSQDPAHAIAPLAYTSTPEVSFNQLKTVIQALPRTEIIQSTDNYLYVEFTSAIMGFVDDVEFYVDRDANMIQVRSASRLGQSDLGVNRERVETIRSQLNAMQATV
jgi:uncharacterized protein (DUF1499 family)